jgi:hypothetical protein
MKKYFYCLILSLIPVFVSCNKNDTPSPYDGSKITVAVLDTGSNTATVNVIAKDVKTLKSFTIGLCFLSGSEPTILNDHIELNVNTDSLPATDLNMICYVTNLLNAKDYNVKGYLKLGTDVYYSANKTFKTKNNILTVTVSNSYIPSGKEYWMVLSNKSTTLVTQKLQNGQTYTFSNNIPDLADFHLFKWDGTNYRLYVESYTDIVPDAFSLSNPYVSTSSGQVNVTISDLSNFLSWGIAGSWWWNMTSSATTRTLATNILNNPDNLFINYIPSSGTVPMYKLVNNVIPNANLTYTMADFTAMTNYANVVVPSNIYFTYTLAGYNTDYYTEFLKYHSYSYLTGFNGTFKLYYPTGIKTNYYFYSFYITATQQSFYNKIGSLPTTYFSTFPTIAINNSSLYKTTTSTIDNYSAYEVMDFCGIYSNSSIGVQWDYYKKPQSSNSVDIPEFPTDVRLKINNISTNDLSFSDVGYLDIVNSTVNSYKSYVDLIIKQSRRFYDVVKERRYYYQWVNKKSFDISAKNLNLPEQQK